MIADQNQRLRSICQELVRVNEILLKGNRILNLEKAEDKQKLEFYSGFYRRISSLFTEKSLNLFQYLTYGRLNEEIEKFHEDNKTHQAFERHRVSQMDQMVTGNPTEQAERLKKNQNMSRIEFEEELGNEMGEPIEGEGQEKMIYYRNYLVKLAQDLEMNGPLFEILEGRLIETKERKRPSLNGEREMVSASFVANFN